MADVNFLRFSFYQIPHLDNTNQDVLVRGWLLLLFTCSGTAQRTPYGMANLDLRGGKTDAFVGGGLAGVRDVNSWWLAG